MSDKATMRAANLSCRWCVPTEVWPWIMCGAVAGALSESELSALCSRGVMQCVALEIDGRPVGGWCVMRHRDRVSIYALATDPHVGLGAWVPVATQWMKNEFPGCRILAAGRPGWGRALARLGWKLNAVEMEACHA